MNIKAFARWATIVATLAAPALVSAQTATKNDQPGANANTPGNTAPVTSPSENPTPNEEKPVPNDREQGMNEKGINDKAMKQEKLTQDELQVLGHLHRVNQLEIDMGKLAEKQGSTDAIKDYGKMLVTDHEKADKDAKALAKRHGQMIRKETAANETDKAEIQDDQAAYKRLKSEKGDTFDRDFLQVMVQGHERELAKTDTAIGKVQSEDLKTMLNDVKSSLQRHADRARELQKNNAQASR